MVDQTATTPAAAEKKAPTVAEDMDARRIFPGVEEAKQYLAASAERFADFGETPVAAPGIDAEGNFDPEIYTDAMCVMVSVLRKQGEGVKAIVVAPVPKVAVLMESEAGKAWVEKILHKELNHVAVRHLRDAEDVLNFVDQMPTTVEGYITSERGTGGIMETFNGLYKGIDAALSGKFPNWAKRRFIKSELKKALESKGYAQEFYPDIEDYKGQSLFEAALAIGQNAAKRKGLDPTIFERWAQTRNSKTYSPEEDEDESLDLDALTDALLDEGESKTEPAAEGAAETPAEPSGEPTVEPSAEPAEVTA
jgi:hypothetical protein